MKQMYFRAIFNFENDTLIRIIPKLKDVIEHDYVKMRHLACDRLNGNYEKWNKEFEELKIERDKNDPLYDFGGTEYCEFIRNKQQPIIDEVNSIAKGCVRLYSTEECDLGGIVVFFGKEITRFDVELEPVEL
jgi:hypothetical protein